MKPLAMVLCLLAAQVRAEPTPVPIPLTLLDVPELFVAPQHVPTWEQSLDLTGGLFRAGHLGIHAGFASLSTAWWSVLLETASATLFDLFMMFAPLPLTSGWMHEEGHRAVMRVIAESAELRGCRLERRHHSVSLSRCRSRNAIRVRIR